MTVRIDAITVDEGLVLRQTQRIDPEHVTELAQAMRRGDVMPPVVLWKRGAELVLLDGHHRVAAVAEMIQRAAEAGVAPLPRAVIRAEVREGNLTDALVWMIDTNKRAKLNVSREDKSQHAWRMTLETGLSAAVVSKTAGVSARTIHHMRSAKRRFEERGAKVPATWREARGPWEPPQMDEGERARTREELTAKIGELWFPLSRHDHALFWEALEAAVSPRRLREGLGWLIDEMGDYADDEAPDAYEGAVKVSEAAPKVVQKGAGNADF